MKTIEIKIDRKTLPKDMQRVKWQTHNDFDWNNWKEGIFCEGDDLFCVGFKTTTDRWDLSWKVLHWLPI